MIVNSDSDHSCCTLERLLHVMTVVRIPSNVLSCFRWVDALELHDIKYFQQELEKLAEILHTKLRLMF